MPITTVVFADDLSGAADAGLQLSEAGISTTLQLHIEDGAAGRAVPDSDKPSAIVVDTDSRNVSVEVARERQILAAASMASHLNNTSEGRASNAPVLYKKVDSTIRGNIGAEIVGLMRRMDLSCCVLAPAFPGAGRTTVGGFQLLSGIPVHRSEMGKDPVAPVKTSQLKKLFDGESGVQCIPIALGTIEAGADAILAEMRTQRQDELTIFICDATCDSDLLNIAKAAGMKSPRPLLAGSAGLASSLVTAFGLGAQDPSKAQNNLLQASSNVSSGKVYVISGSSTQQNKKQIDALMLQFAGRDDVILHRTTEGDVSSLAASAVASMKASTLPPSGLVLTGGATARAVLTLLGAKGMRVCRAVEAAVPLMSIVGGTFEGVPCVTKAGALGSDDALSKSVRAIQRLDAKRKQGTPLIGITMGDPCGIGPEIIAKCLARPECHDLAKYVVIGSPQRMEFGIDAAGLRAKLKVRNVSKPGDAVCEFGTIDVVSPFEIKHDEIVTGVVCPEAGRCAAEWVIAATKFAVDGEIDAIATAPLNKEAMHKGGYKYGGHTELLRDYSGAKTSRLCLADPRGITVVHATCHIPFKDIPTRMADEGKITETIRLTRQFCVDMGYLKAASKGKNASTGQEKEPKIAVAGLNPHCEPIFGDEEVRIIQPAIDEALRKGWNVHGPIPADTVFLRAKKGEFDAVVAMYHDQGHIPAKVSGFGDTVNCTLGLPIIRTSVDHGTAFDIAGKGIAHDQNLVTACAMAAQMAKTRKEKRMNVEEKSNAEETPSPFVCSMCGVASLPPPDFINGSAVPAAQLLSCECCK